MQEYRVGVNSEATSEVLWKPYYLKKRVLTEHTLRGFLNQTRESGLLSPNSFAAVEQGVIKNGGKRVRPVLTHLVHDLVGGRSKQINTAAILAELAHRGSLLEDDIDDSAIQRDGKLPVYHQFGLEATRAGCDFLYSAPLSIIGQMPIESELRKDLKSEYLRLSRIARVGQNKDVAWSKSDGIPTTAEYLQMCEEKCAAIEYAIRVGAMMGNASYHQTEALVSAGNKSATAFQLVDDLISLRPGSDDYGSDIVEGKKTLPVIHVVKKSSKATRLLSLLNSHSRNPQIIAEAVDILTVEGGINNTNESIIRLVNEAKYIIQANFPDSHYRKVLLAMVDYGVKRTA